MWFSLPEFNHVIHSTLTQFLPPANIAHVVDRERLLLHRKHRVNVSKTWLNFLRNFVVGLRVSGTKHKRAKQKSESSFFFQIISLFLYLTHSHHMLTRGTSSAWVLGPDASVRKDDILVAVAFLIIILCSLHQRRGWIWIQNWDMIWVEH